MLFSGFVVGFVVCGFAFVCVTGWVGCVWVIVGFVCGFLFRVFRCWFTW